MLPRTGGANVRRPGGLAAGTGDIRRRSESRDHQRTRYVSQVRTSEINVIRVRVSSTLLSLERVLWDSTDNL